MRRAVLTAVAAVLLAGANGSRLEAAEATAFRRVAETRHGRFYAVRGQKVDARRSEEFLGRLFDLFGSAPSGWRVEYYRHASVADLERRIGFAAFGVTDVAALRIDSVHEFHPHELVHAVAGSLGRPPLPFSEGLAVALTSSGLWRGRAIDDVAREYLAGGGSLDRLLRTFGEQPDRDYAVAGSLVGFLLDEGGIEPLVAFLRSCAEPGRYDAALRAAYGRGSADLDYAWQRSLRRPAASRAWYEPASWPASLRPADPGPGPRSAAITMQLAAGPTRAALEPAAANRLD